MSKEEMALDIIRRVIDKDMPKIMKEIIGDKKLDVTRITRLLATIDSALSMLNVLRAELEA